MQNTRTMCWTRYRALCTVHN